MPTLLLEHQAQLDQPEAAAPVLLGKRQREQPGVGEGPPEVAVDALVAPLDLLDPLDRGLAVEDLRRQIADCLLLLRKLKSTVSRSRRHETPAT